LDSKGEKMRLLLLIALFTVNCFAGSPLAKYKLVITNNQNEQQAKQELFSAILKDMAKNLENNINKLQTMDDQAVMKHFGQLSQDDNLAAAAPMSSENVRSSLAKKMEDRSKELARTIYNRIQNASMGELLKELQATINTDNELMNEAGDQVAQVEEVPEGASAPKAPGFYRNYYNYYGYNYLYNYGNYRRPYPVYNNYRYYYPLYNQAQYQYTYRYYPRSYYNYYYYPRYNRTNRLLATGVFGLAAVGSFVDWLLD
jgi:hypothetical protein